MALAIAWTFVWPSIAHLGNLGAFWCLARAAGLEGLPFLRYLLLVPLGFMVNAIPIAPNGAGQGEFAFEWLFDQVLAGSGSTAASAMLALRVFTLVLGLVGGVVYLMGVRMPKDGETSR